jgi:hypothetical protein
MNEPPHPYATDTRPTYENFEARCPVCWFWNIFNRVTDLADCGLITFETVSCLDASCGRPFNINGDIVNAAYHMFSMQCYSFKKEKRYSHCVVSLAQAFELFFSHYLYEHLVTRPLRTDSELRTASDYNALSEQLYRQIETLGYRKLRNVFLHVVLERSLPASMLEAERIIASISDRRSDPTDAFLAAYPEEAIASLLVALKGSGVAELRNRVAHQEGYRPTLLEVENALSETRNLLFGLGIRLGVR